MDLSILPLNHGKICKKIEIYPSQTLSSQFTTPEPTVTLNFYTGVLLTEEILSMETAQSLLIQLKRIISDK